MPSIRQRITDAWRILRAREYVGPGGYGFNDPDEYGDNHSKLFRPLGGGKDEARQPYDYHMALQTASYLYEKSALFAALHNLTAHYIVGDGVKVRANDKRTQAVIDRFIEDPHNTLFSNPREWALRLRIYGEMAMPVVVGDDGFVRMAYWNPHQYGIVKFANGNDATPDFIELLDSNSQKHRETPVWAHDRDRVQIDYPAAISRVTEAWGAKTVREAGARHREHVREVDALASREWARIVESRRAEFNKRATDFSYTGQAIEDDLASRARLRLRMLEAGGMLSGSSMMTPPERFRPQSEYGAKTPDTVWRVIRRRDRDESTRGEYPFWHDTQLLDGNCFLFRVNAVTTARGRPDFMQVYHLCDKYDLLLDEEVIRAQLLKAFAYAMTFENASKEDLDKYRAEYAMPRPGEVLFLNGKVKFEAISPDLAEASTADLLRALKSHILAAGGFPPAWVGEDSANRATALAQGEPTLKGLQAKQSEMRYVYETVMQFVIDSARFHGGLERDADGTFEVVMPELLARTSEGVRSMYEQLAAIINPVNAKLAEPALAKIAISKLWEAAGLVTKDDVSAAKAAPGDPAPEEPAAAAPMETPQEEPAPLP